MRGGLWDTEGHAAFNVFRLQNQRIQPLVWGNTGDLKSSVLLHKVVTSINRWRLVFALSIALYLTAARRRTYRWPAAARLTHLIRVSGSRRQRDRNEHTTHTNTHTIYIHILYSAGVCWQDPAWDLNIFLKLLCDLMETYRTADKQCCCRCCCCCWWWSSCMLTLLAQRLQQTFPVKPSNPAVEMICKFLYWCCCLFVTLQRVIIVT